MQWFLLPGLDGTGRLFAPLLGALSPQIKATAIPYAPENFASYAELSAYVAEKLLSHQPSIIVAESFSGPTAIRVAAASPRNLRAIVLCASFAYIPAPFLFRTFFSYLSPCIFAVTPPRWIVRHFLAGSDAPDELLAQLYEAISEGSPSVFAHRLKMVLAADERQTLCRVRVPMLCLFPLRDRLLGCRSADLMRRIRGDISSVPIDAPHFVLQRKPVEAIQAIQKWLQEQSITG